MKITYTTYMANLRQAAFQVYFIFIYLFIYLFIFWNGQNMLTPETCGR